MNESPQQWLVACNPQGLGAGHVDIARLVRRMDAAVNEAAPDHGGADGMILPSLVNRLGLEEAYVEVMECSLVKEAQGRQWITTMAALKLDGRLFGKDGLTDKAAMEADVLHRAEARDKDATQGRLSWGAKHYNAFIEELLPDHIQRAITACVLDEWSLCAKEALARQTAPSAGISSKVRL